MKTFPSRSASSAFVSLGLKSSLLALLLGATRMAVAQLPNAWQIDDASTVTGSRAEYGINLSPELTASAHTNAWQYTVTMRMVQHRGNFAHVFLYSHGTNRFTVGIDLDSSTNLAALIGVPGSFTNVPLATNNTVAATSYHEHRLTYDPVSKLGTYWFDGAAKYTWGGDAVTTTADGLVQWGSGSSGGSDVANYYRTVIEIVSGGSTNVVASYDAGLAGNPPIAPGPTTQGWTLLTTNAGVFKQPVSPDSVALGGVVTTLPPADVAPTSVTFNAQIISGALPASYYWEYGLTMSYGSVTAPQLTSSTNIAETLSGLTANTTFHYRVVISNLLGVAVGNDVNFTTPVFATTLAVDEFGPGEARLNGLANPSGVETLSWFEWGATTNYDQATAPQTIGAGTADVPLAAVITSLITGSSYEFRLVASNSYGVAYGMNQTFQQPGFVMVASAPEASDALAWGDFNNDGLLDIIGSGLWQNTGSGFTNVITTAAPGFFEYQADWVDHNQDGWLDFVAPSSLPFWLNMGNGFTNSPTFGPKVGSLIAPADYNNDGRLDFIVYGGGIATLWRNTGSEFVNVTSEQFPNDTLPQLSEGAVAWGDYDNDGRLDLFITGSILGGTFPNFFSVPLSQLWRNTSSGFSNVTAVVSLNLPSVWNSSVTWGDYDNDGRLDFFLTGATTNNAVTSQLWRNTGSGFTNVPIAGLPGVDNGSVVWGDYDNDGRLDFLLSGRQSETNVFGFENICQLWRNTGSGFSNVTTQVLPQLDIHGGTSAAWGDYDRDGRLDFVLSDYGQSGSLGMQVWRNILVSTNQAPTAPTGLSATASSDGFTLSWNAATDEITPTAGLTYNVRVGHTPGGTDVLVPLASTSGERQIPARGNAGANTFKQIFRPEGGIYYWSVQTVDSSFAGSAFSVEQQFILPEVTTLPANPVTGVTGQLNGVINPYGETTTAWFEWGATTNYGNATPPQQLAGAAPVNLAVVLTNLDPAINYQFRAVASNDFGVIYGANLGFTFFAQVDLPELPVVRNSSAAWADYDNDGQLDFLLTGNTNGTTTGGSAQLWRNTGTGFTNVTASVAPGLPNVFDGVVAWGDYDNDGRLDFFLTGRQSSSMLVSQLWRNTGAGFVDVTTNAFPNDVLSPAQRGGVAWGDYDNDGRLDLLRTGQTSSNNVSQIWRNTGAGFTNVTASVAPGLPGLIFSSVAWGDYDNDGQLDFLLTGGSYLSQIWRNTGTGFANVTASIAPGLPGVTQGAAAWGDYDNDGRLDFLITGSTSTNLTTQLWRNTGTGFTNVTDSVAPNLSGVSSSSVAWGDYNNDGRLDFFIMGVAENGKVSQLWQNTGSGFNHVTAAVAPGMPGFSQGTVAWGDYDNDGRLDFLLVGYSDIGVRPQLWRNNTPLTNAPPGVPTGLALTATTNAVMLSWNSATDDHTPASGLTYNVRAGSSPGGIDLYAGHVNAANGFRRVPAMGNAYLRHSLSLTGLTNGQTVYWSVQAVDTSFAGGLFATETSVVTIPTLSITPSDTTNAIVSWTPPTWGWLLQSTPSLGAAWTNVPFTEGMPVIEPMTAPANFYRLRQP